MTKRRRLQFGLKHFLVCSLLCGIAVAFYVRRSQSLADFRTLERELKVHLRKEVSRLFLEHFEGDPRGKPMSLNGTGASASIGTIFEPSEFNLSGGDRVYFGTPLGDLEWPEITEHSTSFGVKARLGVFDSKPTVENIDFGRKLNSIAIPSIESWMQDRRLSYSIRELY